MHTKTERGPCGPRFVSPTLFHYRGLPAVASAVAALPLLPAEEATAVATVAQTEEAAAVATTMAAAAAATGVVRTMAAARRSRNDRCRRGSRSRSGHRLRSRHCRNRSRSYRAGAAGVVAAVAAAALVLTAEETAAAATAEEAAALAAAAPAEETTTLTSAMATGSVRATVTTRAFAAERRQIPARGRCNQDDHAVHRRSPPVPAHETLPGRGSVSATTRVPLSHAVIARQETQNYVRRAKLCSEDSRSRRFRSQR